MVTEQAVLVKTEGLGHYLKWNNPNIITSSYNVLQHNSSTATPSVKHKAEFRSELLNDNVQVGLEL